VFRTPTFEFGTSKQEFQNLCVEVQNFNTATKSVARESIYSNANASATTAWPFLP
jgi:hypothetical protein